MLALNTDTKNERVITLAMPAERFTLSAAELASTMLVVNGVEPSVASDGTVGPLKPEPVKAGTVSLAPATVTFLVIPSARNQSCMQEKPR